MRNLLLMTAVLGLSACNPVEVMGDSDTAIEQFHDHWNAGNLDAMWHATHPEFRTGLTQQQFDKVMGDFGGVLGEVESTERESFNINTQNGVTTTTIMMRTQFANGEGVEQFFLRGHGEEQKIFYYYVESDLLNGYTAPEGADEYRPDDERPAVEPVE
ncbi:hypothetical protein [Aurantiacibacter sp. D1-12]|uniref:hypothetical protein n=1 Tax=Aurantiacibacter sp. D1-12 TaxID=2993658 RepID=UPI00237C5D01|nr:hypothetical protein [Aurantiacibacter sp. D1-12]MDE1468385.1 hypothetical protein [Aurantiacibacter sp. D1-12]